MSRAVQAFALAFRRPSLRNRLLLPELIGSSSDVSPGERRERMRSVCSEADWRQTSSGMATTRVETRRRRAAVEGALAAIVERAIAPEKLKRMVGAAVAIQI